MFRSTTIIRKLAVGSGYIYIDIKKKIQYIYVVVCYAVVWQRICNQ